MCSAEAFSVLYARAAVQHGEAFVHLRLFTENRLGASGLDGLSGDNRDQVGVVPDPRGQSGYPGIILTIRGTLGNTHASEQSCQPREACLTMAVIWQWAPGNFTQTLLPCRALA